MARGFFASVALLAGVGCSDADAKAHAMVEEGAMLLDVRTVGEFSGGHLRDSINIPVQSLAGRIGELDPSRAIVVYCRSGARSRSAMSTLRAQGFEVYDMGSMSAWGVSDDIVR